MDKEKFVKSVWDYYHTHGRDLPWRHDTTPYSILVSEIMLQQTQVKRVLVKYAEFLAAFPNFEALHRASQGDVLRVWQGMGYNRRALWLKKIADIVVTELNGELPRIPEELVKLPGIGTNTAGSIAAFAYNYPSVFIETNIRRIYIFHFFQNTFQNDNEILSIMDPIHHHGWDDATQVVIPDLIGNLKGTQIASSSKALETPRNDVIVKGDKQISLMDPRMREDDEQADPYFQGNDEQLHNHPTALLSSSRMRGSREAISYDDKVHDKEILQLVAETLDRDNPREWYWALMDYGSYLASVVENPNRQSKHYTKQSKFEGSKRALRGAILKVLLQSPKTNNQLQEQLKDHGSYDYFDEVLEELVKERFITGKNGVYCVV